MKTEAKEECKSCIVKEIVNSELSYCIHIDNDKSCEEARSILARIDERRKHKKGL